jgi:hypothetical protein
MLIRNLTKGRRVAAVLVLAVVSLTACGGGEDPTGGGEDELVSWNNSANGTTVLDWNNDRYGVRVTDRVVVSKQDNSRLPRLTVNTSAELMDGGVKIGSVSAGVSTSGATIAVFKCTNGRDLNIIETSTTYSYSCI